MMVRRFRAGSLAALLLPGMLAACDVYRHDDEGPGYESPAPAPLPPPPPVAESSGGREVIKPGQTLYGVAREHDLPLRALIDANGLEPPYMLKVGQVLIIPNVRQTTVQPGETLAAVARRNDVEESTLARLNHLDPPYQLKAGTKLILPAPAEVAIAAPARPMAPQPPAPPAYIPPSPPSTSPPSYIPPPPISSSSASTSGRFGATPLPPPGPASQAAAPPSPVAPGEKPLPPVKPVPPPPAPAAAPPPVAVPAPAAPPPAVASAPPTRLEPPPPPPPPPPAPKSPPPAPAAAPAPPPEPEEAPPAAVESASPAAVAAIVQSHKPPTAPLFTWPVRGTVVSTFGPAAGGTHNDGINISAPEGAEVDAAESGIVAYAGNELKGFGNLLLIKHADGWVTAYAHNKELLVAKGDHVRRGQAIAKVGATGGVTKPQLHFELRQKTTAVDPLDHLPPAGAD